MGRSRDPFCTFATPDIECDHRTRNMAHLQQNIAWSQAGALDAAWFDELHGTFRWHDRNWLGQT
jgi:hypothetical protein